MQIKVTGKRVECKLDQKGDGLRWWVAILSAVFFGAQFILFGFLILTGWLVFEGIGDLASLWFLFIFILSGLAMARSFRRATVEYLKADEEGIEIRKKGILGERMWMVTWDEIAMLKHYVPVTPSATPFDTEDFDYIGIQSQQKVIDKMLTDGRVELRTHEGANLYFGRDLPNWDFEELVSAIESATGRKLNATADADAEMD